MSFEITGKLHKVFETENKTDTFRARDFVIETIDGSYSNYIKFQLVQDRCSLIEDFEEGEQVKVHFDLRGREWNDKYFTNLNAWRLEKVEAQTADAQEPLMDGSFPTASDEPATATDTDTDDLPF